MVAAVTPSLDPAPARVAGWVLSVTPRAQWEGTAPTAHRRANARMRAGATQRQDTACVSQDGRASSAPTRAPLAVMVRVVKRNASATTAPSVIPSMETAAVSLATGALS